MALETVIDATEGGLPKAHTQRSTLAEALARHAADPLPVLPAASGRPDADRLRDTADHLNRRIDEVRELARISRETTPLLRQMIRHQRDRARMDRLFARLEKKKKRVAELGDAFSLINHLNQIGAYKRQRADRAICVADGDDAYDRQRKQLDRDLENVRWLIDGCTYALGLFEAAAERLGAQLEASGATARGAAA
jgi:hypothetical protein